MCCLKLWRCLCCGSACKKEKKTDCLDVILAILLPPAMIYRKEGCSCNFWISVILTVTGYVPGSVHAVIVISSN
ncbi:Proteolipid membrane potential modulator - like 2 [Theobroma cacao]|uniref:Plasma membrane proteolipid 3 n=1 Tax=Theobroma cacao TaxID=3641 RepID=A0A061DZL2_THECC|nr:Uncharacterized protein TCM_004955 [Theobroma cacao]WRX08500.1 Proteolipid membrane potential modulator - like 2 [Theobroma cacao]